MSFSTATLEDKVHASYCALTAVHICAPFLSAGILKINISLKEKQGYNQRHVFLFFISFFFSSQLYWNIVAVLCFVSAIQ